MLTHRETIRLLLKAMVNVWSVVGTVLGALIVILGGILGPQPGTRFAGVVDAVNPYRLWVAIPLFFVGLYIAFHKAVDVERAGTEKLESRINELQRLLESRLKVVIERCCYTPVAAWIGVGNPSMKTVENALVYVSVSSLDVSDRLVQWAGMQPDQAIPIHHAPLPTHHHHTVPLVSVGDAPGQFFLHFAYGNKMLGPGRYEANVCVKGQDATAATARLEIVCALPRSLTVRLVPEAPPR